MRETVKEYETVESERDQYISDLSGIEIDDDELVRLYADLEIPVTGPSLPDIKAQTGFSHSGDLVEVREYVLDVINEIDAATADGMIHVSREECAELMGVDEEIIEERGEIPEVAIGTVEAQDVVGNSGGNPLVRVGERPLFGASVILLAAPLMAFIIVKQFAILPVAIAIASSIIIVESLLERKRQEKQ